MFFFTETELRLREGDSSLFSIDAASTWFGGCCRWSPHTFSCFITRVELNTWLPSPESLCCRLGCKQTPGRLQMLYYILKAPMLKHPIVSLLHQLLYLPCIINTNKTPLFTGLYKTERNRCNCLEWIVFFFLSYAITRMDTPPFFQPNTNHHQIL